MRTTTTGIKDHFSAFLILLPYSVYDPAILLSESTRVKFPFARPNPPSSTDSAGLDYALITHFHSDHIEVPTTGPGGRVQETTTWRYTSSPSGRRITRVTLLLPTNIMSEPPSSSPPSDLRAASTLSTE